MSKMSLEDVLYYECGYSSAICDVIELLIKYGFTETSLIVEEIKKLEKEKLGK